MSRTHARIDKIQDDYYIFDNKSKFGTLVKEDRLSMDVTRIKQGIQIGRTVITFEKARKGWFLSVTTLYLSLAHIIINLHFQIYHWKNLLLFWTIPEKIEAPSRVEPLLISRWDCTSAAEKFYHSDTDCYSLQLGFASFCWEGPCLCWICSVNWW